MIKMLKNKKILLILAFIFIFATTAFTVTDYLIKSPSGNLILDAATSYAVKINKTLQVDSIKNYAGTSYPPGMVPIGGMIAVMPNTHANSWQPPTNCTTVKDGFMRAGYSGSACTVPVGCSDCVIPAGTTLPLMNNSKYMRGSDTSGTTGGSNSKYLPAHYHSMGTGADLYTGGGATTIVATSGSRAGQAPSLGSPWGDGYGTCGTSDPIISFHGGEDNRCSGSCGCYVNMRSGDHGHSFGGRIGLVSGGCDGNSGSSCSIDPQPSYMEVVWVIRVK